MHGIVFLHDIWAFSEAARCGLGIDSPCLSTCHIHMNVTSCGDALRGEAVDWTRRSPGRNWLYGYQDLITDDPRRLLITVTRAPRFDVLRCIFTKHGDFVSHQQPATQRAHRAASAAFHSLLGAH